jgi:hypothetical protein
MALSGSDFFEVVFFGIPHGNLKFSPEKEGVYSAISPGHLYDMRVE